jgi:hypothetical protein
MPRLRMRCVPDATADVKALLHRLLRRHRAAERFTLDRRGRAAAAERLARLYRRSHDDPSPSLYEPTDLEVAAAARALLTILDGADLASEARELVDARELVEVSLVNMLALCFLIESTNVRARFRAVSSNSIASLFDAIGLLGGDIDDPALNIFAAKHASDNIAALAVRRFLPEHGRWFVRRTPPPRSFAQIARRLFG